MVWTKDNRMPLCAECTVSPPNTFWREAHSNELCENPDCGSLVSGQVLVMLVDGVTWHLRSWGRETVVGDFDKGDGVRISLQLQPTCYRRGPWVMMVEVANGPKHHLWGCFDEADQPTRYYHHEASALNEAGALLKVLLEDRLAHGDAPWSS